MSQEIISKHCYKCGFIKPVSEFCKDKNRSDGLHGMCKDCVKKYKNTPNGKSAVKKANQRYSLTNKGKEALKKAKQKEYTLHPEKLQAKQSVKNAVRNNTITNPKHLTCTCGQPAKEYHHLDYYSKKGLNIVPVCVPCHKKLHR